MLRRLCFLIVLLHLLKFGEAQATFSEELAKKNCVILHNPIDVGIGAIFFSLLPLLDRFDRGLHAGVKVDLDGGCYLDPDRGPNWWEYFFEPLELGDQSALPHVFNKTETLRLLSEGYSFPREKGAKLLQRYVHLKEDLKQEIDTFVASNFQEYYVIGVHHRGTDKISEAPLVPYYKTMALLEETISLLSEEDVQRLRIFVATDEKEFLDYLSVMYPSCMLYNDFVRSNRKGQSLHYSEDLYASNYQKGKEAILDCILLSKCDVLIYPKTSSFSTLSGLFNEELPLLPICKVRSSKKRKS